MNGYEYICGTTARFRKKFPDLYERKEKKPVFIDSSMLDKIEDIPDEIKAELIGKSRISRMNREDFAINTEDENVMKSHNLSEDDAKLFITEKDKRYHKRHMALTGSNRGDRHNRDMLIDSSLLGVDGTAELIESLARKVVENESKTEAGGDK